METESPSVKTTKKLDQINALLHRLSHRSQKPQTGPSPLCDAKGMSADVVGCEGCARISRRRAALPDMTCPKTEIQH